MFLIIFVINICCLYVWFFIYKQINIQYNTIDTSLVAVKKYDYETFIAKLAMKPNYLKWDNIKISITGFTCLLITSLYSNIPFLRYLDKEVIFETVRIMFITCFGKHMDRQSFMIYASAAQSLCQYSGSDFRLGKREDCQCIVLSICFICI